MTERTIKSLAKELAGAFYEAKRSGRFRSMDSLTRTRALRQLPNGQHVEVPVTVPFRKAYPNAHAFATAHWPFFVDAARRCMVTMLALPDARVHSNLKEAIYEALKEDHEKRQRHATGGNLLLQQKVGDHVAR